MMEYDGYWWIIGVYGVLFQNFPFYSGLIFQKPRKERSSMFFYFIVASFPPKELLHVFFPPSLCQVEQSQVEGVA